MLLPEDDFGKIIQRSIIPQEPQITTMNNEEKNQNSGMMEILRALFGESSHINVSSNEGNSRVYQLVSPSSALKEGYFGAAWAKDGEPGKPRRVRGTGKRTAAEA